MALPATQTITIYPPKSNHSKPSKPSSRSKRPNYNQIHRNPLPIEVHPLPVLIPHNPLSLVAIALSYFVQILSPPIQPTYHGYFSSATSSIHVTDAAAIRKLWEMGFFGRGSLSRSEPTWLENQKKKGGTAEENTAQRREERKQQKLERARREQEDLDSKITEELHLNGHTSGSTLKTNAGDISDIASVLESTNVTPTQEVRGDRFDGNIQGFEEWKKALDLNGVPTPPPTSTCSESSLPDSRPLKKLQRMKTVRFSPTIEAREFDLSSPIMSPIKSPGSSPAIESEDEEEMATQNQEHLNISLEEAFFLSYGLGVLQVHCDDSETVLPPLSLLALFRRYSYHPPTSLSIVAASDDPFMISYAAYHHYRSLGWVVRSGVKFGIDYLLYNRGPAFSHAEFAVAVLPAYSNSYWKETEDMRKKVHQKTKRNWWWLHGVNRVQSQVHKHLVICYVDIPPPLQDDERGRATDIAFVLSRYKVRDISVKRWTPNRSRD